MSKKISQELERKKLALIQRRLAQAFRPIAAEVGWISYEWNRLHEALGQLFALIIPHKGTIPHEMGFAIWYTTTNERAQREMLKAAVKIAHAQDDLSRQPVYGEIEWILNQVNALAGRRNNAIHAPFAFVHHTDTDAVEIIPDIWFGHPRASELKDATLHDEFRWYRDHLSKLATHAGWLAFNFAFDPDIFPLPKRPVLPPRGHYRSRVRSRRRKNTKARARPHPPSRA